MITGLDHLIVLTPDIDAGIAQYRALLGFGPAWRSGADGVANATFVLDNTAIELVAPAGEGPSSVRARAVLDTQGEGLASLCFRVADIAATHRRLGRVGLAPEDVTDGGSIDASSGATLAWQRTRAATDAAHGVRLFFLAMQNERPRAAVQGEGALTSVDHVVVNTQNPDRAAALYGARLQLGMALDRSNPQWGRLMFFRCGDLVVEVVQRPGKSDADAPDRLWGFCLRTNDIEATHARLAANGVAVSDIRTGRKPGTRVLTVKSSTCGVPVLVLQPSAGRD